MQDLIRSKIDWIDGWISPDKQTAKPASQLGNLMVFLIFGADAKNENP